MKIEHLALGELLTNTYIISSEKGGCAIVDPAAEPEKIIKFIEERSYSPRYILITHCHHDHIGAVKALHEAWGVPVVMSEADYNILIKPEQFNARYQKHVAGMQFSVDRFARDGDEITMDELSFKVIATPGHTVGGVCYLCGDSLFSGDTLFYGTVGRCDLYSGDFEAMLESVKRLSDMPGDFDVFPGHGTLTTMAAERKNNPYINGSYINMDNY